MVKFRNFLQAIIDKYIQLYKREEERNAITSKNFISSKNQLLLYFLFKKSFTSLIRLITPYKQIGMESKYNFRYILIGTFWNPIRYCLIFLIKFFDLISSVPYGSKTLPSYRTLFYGNLSLKVKCRDEGVDQRNLKWKRNALTMLIKYIIKYNLKSNITFLEVGAASGLVSLFLAEWTKKRGINYDITCIEPCLKNIQFLEEAALENNHSLKIIPFALSKKNGWIEFSSDASRGFVGSAIDNVKIIETNKVPSISFTLLNEYINNIEICYIDAYLNESEIISNFLKFFPDIKCYLIEFDFGVPDAINIQLKNSSYTLIDQWGMNYLFARF